MCLSSQLHEAQKQVNQRRIDLETWDRWPDRSVRVLPRKYWEDKLKKAIEDLHKLEQKQAKVIPLNQYA